MRYLRIPLEATVLIAAIVLLALPDSRTPPLRFLFFVLWAANMLLDLRSTYFRGMFKMTPGQIHQHIRSPEQPARPRTTALNGLASIVGMITFFVPIFS